MPRFCVPLMAIALTVLTTSFARADATADEWKGLVGTWKVEKATLFGTDATDTFKTLVLTSEVGKYKVSFNGMDDLGTVKLDLDKKPKQIIMVGTEGANKDKTHYGIYELDKDTLTVCYALDGGKAPEKFESKEGTMTLLVIYKRDKK